MDEILLAIFSLARPALTCDFVKISDCLTFFIAETDPIYGPSDGSVLNILIAVLIIFPVMFCCYMFWVQLLVVTGISEPHMGRVCKRFRECASGKPTVFARASLPAALVRQFVYKFAS